MFSGKAGRLAGMWAQTQAEQTANAIKGLLGEGQANSLAALNEGKTQGLAALGQGYDAARPEYQGAIDRFDPWTTAGQGALTAYQGSLGLGGDGARDAAVSSFRAAPGYEYSVNQATDAVARKASALGALGSGNTMQAISDRAQGMADQGYKDWQGQLQGLSSTGLQATGAQAGLQKSLGDLGAQQGRDQSNIYTGTAGQQAGVYGNFAGLGASNLANLGQQTIEAGTGALQAGQQASANRFGFGLGLANIAASLGGKFLGGAK